MYDVPEGKGEFASPVAPVILLLLKSNDKIMHMPYSGAAGMLININGIFLFLFTIILSILHRFSIQANDFSIGSINCVRHFPQT
jgi:hypothetical protein